MTGSTASRVAIVDYKLGNLFSVRQAFAHAGIAAAVTNDKDIILAADAVVLPGVGAFRDAMETLHGLDLVDVLRDKAQSGSPMFGICLGLQLLMEESEEMGRTKGLGIIPGPVVRLDPGRSSGGAGLKVPVVGWRQVQPAPDDAAWSGTPLEGTIPGAFFYFVHSYRAQPADPATMLAVAPFGNGSYCAAVRKENVFGFQFHPERSGETGLGLYRWIARHLENSRLEP